MPTATAQGAESNQKALLRKRIGRLLARIKRIEFRQARDETKKVMDLLADDLAMCTAELDYKSKKFKLL